MDYDRKVDITDLCSSCGLPMGKISKELKDMQSGSVLLVFSDEISNLDKVSLKYNVSAFCRQSGDELLSWETSGEEDTLVFYIKNKTIKNKTIKINSY